MTDAEVNRALGALTESIPLLYHNTARQNEPDFLGNETFAVVLLDTATGQLAMHPLALNFDGQTIQMLTGEIEFWPQRIVLGTDDGVKYVLAGG